MKVGLRTPNLKKSLKAKTTGRAKRAFKQSLIPGYGKKGMGYIKDPKKAIYNKVYQKTTIDGLAPLKKEGSVKASSGTTNKVINETFPNPTKENKQPIPTIPIKDGKAKIGKRYYSKKSILKYRLLFIVSGWIMIIAGCFSFPLKILFIGLGIFFLFCAHSYKKIASQCS